MVNIEVFDPKSLFGVEIWFTVHFLSKFILVSGIVYFKTKEFQKFEVFKSKRLESFEKLSPIPFLNPNIKFIRGGGIKNQIIHYLWAKKFMEEKFRDSLILKQKNPDP